MFYNLVSNFQVRVANLIHTMGNLNENTVSEVILTTITFIHMTIWLTKNLTLCFQQVPIQLPELEPQKTFSHTFHFKKNKLKMHRIDDISNMKFFITALQLGK